MCVATIAALPILAATISITPSSGPVSGGTTVTLKGDFAASPYYVIFGLTTAPAPATRIDEHTLTTVTPSHLPGAVSVRLFNVGSFTNTGVTFTFTGDASEAFETLLLPVYLPPITGQFGSQFRTALTGHNVNEMIDLVGDIEVYGLPFECVPDCSGLPSNFHPSETVSSGNDLYVFGAPNGHPGRLLRVLRSDVAALNLNLRAYDTSRSSTNFGTEIPIPRSGDFRTARFALTGVPLDSRFRLMLRLYSTSQTGGPVLVTVNGKPFTVQMSTTADSFEPSYGEFTAFPQSATPTTATVTIEPAPGSSVGPLWGFITVTNNDTQHITAISPQP
jgi:hypothetical protein